MNTTVSMVVQNVDLSDLETLVLISEQHVDDLAWASVDGLVTFTVHVPTDHDPVCDVIDAVHRVENALPSAKVLRVFEDFVSASDIADRTGFSRETVRTWSTGARGSQDFPTPAGTLGGGSRGASKFWIWREVCEWLRATHRFDMDDEHYPTGRQVAEINAHVERLSLTLDQHWQTAHAASSWKNHVEALILSHQVTFLPTPGGREWQQAGARVHDATFAQGKERAAR